MQLFDSAFKQLKILSLLTTTRCSGATIHRWFLFMKSSLKMQKLGSNTFVSLTSLFASLHNPPMICNFRIKSRTPQHKRLLTYRPSFATPSVPSHRDTRADPSHHRFIFWRDDLFPCRADVSLLKCDLRIFTSVCSAPPIDPVAAFWSLSLQCCIHCRQ